jgi:hypothetical protein
MTRHLHRRTAFLGRVLVAFILTMTPVLSQPACAQPPGDPSAAQQAEGESSGRPLDGYLGTTVLVGLALFIVGKSARR